MTDETATPNEDIEGEVKYCISNMVQSMTAWRPELLAIFHQLYAEKFCTQCGRVKQCYRDLSIPCPCSDNDF